MPTEHIAFRCPPDLLQAIKDRQAETGEARTTLIIKILRLGLNAPEPEPELVSDEILQLVKSLQAEMQELKQKMAEMESAIQDVKQTVIQISDTSAGESPNNELVTVAEEFIENVTAEDLVPSDLLVEDNGEELIPNPPADVQDISAVEKVVDEIPNPHKDVEEDLVLSPENLALEDVKLTKKQLHSKANSITRTLKDAGYRITATIIREFILEMHPNIADWSTDDARLEIIRAVKKRYPRK